MTKRNQRMRFHTQIESMMAQIRFIHSVKHMKSEQVYNEYDPNFFGYVPLETDTNSALLSDMPSEFKKLFNSATNPDLQSSVRGSVSNEMQAREQEDFDELSQKYFQAKWEFYVKMKLD